MRREINTFFGFSSMALLVVIWGCEAEEPFLDSEDATPIAECKRTAEANLVLLHQEPIENGNAIEFYEVDLEPGLAMVSEVGLVPNLPTELGEGTAEEIFRRIRPGLVRQIESPARVSNH